MTFEPLASASTVRWNLRGEPTYDVARAEKERGALTVPAGDDTRATGRIAPVVAVPATSRRRRPSGEPPPLPRTVDVRSRLLWGAVGLAAVLSIAFLASDVLNGVTRLDLAVSRALDRIKWEPLTQTLSTYSKFLGSSVTVAVIAWSTLIAILVLRQFRHLIVYAALLLGVSVVASALASWVGRMRPADVSQLIRWDGYAFPSRSVIGLGLVFAGIVFTLIPAGTWRRRASFIAIGVLAVFAFARVYLGVDHLTDVLCGLAFGWALAVATFRLATPDEAFPVSYRKGTTAHLELTPARCEAITRAVAQQLGLEVAAVERFGLGGSAGSTPLRVWLAATTSRR